MPQERVGQLDVLRAMACMCVLVAHCDSVYEMPPLPRELGPIGVAIFFALSGYLITSGLLRQPDLVGFYLKRATRILPPYFLLLLVLMPFWWSVKLAWCVTFSFNLLYVSGARDYFHVQQTSEVIPPIGHLWSLCVEEHYYWFWPLVLLTFGRKVAMVGLVAIVLATPAMAVWLIEAMDSRGANPEMVAGVLSRVTPTQLTSVAIGSLVALADPRWLQPKQLGRFAVTPTQWCGLALIGGALWLNEGVIRESFVWLCGNDAQYSGALEPTRIHFWGAGLALVAMPCASLARLKSWQYLGRISYGLYLYHLPIFAWFGLAAGGKHQTWPTAVMAILTTIGVAACSYHFMERPFIAWGRQQAHSANRSPVQFRKLGLGVSLLLLVSCGLTMVANRTSPPLSYVLNIAARIPLEQRRYDLVPIGTAMTAYRWLGVDHYADSLGFRRTTDFPARDPERTRIVTVGDSYSWGACVRENQTYSAVLGKELQRLGYRTEVLNCGKAGGQAEDAYMTIRDQLLLLEPDVILYAATLTDFLPANQGWENHQYDEWYLPENENRFKAAVSQMHTLCREHNIQFAAFVFFQNPSDERLTKIATHVEGLLGQAGVPTVSIAEYLRKHAEQDFRVYVPFDEHPNAACHRLMGELLAQAVSSGQLAIQ